MGESSYGLEEAKRRSFVAWLSGSKGVHASLLGWPKAVEFTREGVLMFT